LHATRFRESLLASEEEVFSHVCRYLHSNKKPEASRLELRATLEALEADERVFLSPDGICFI
jgi:hypothetical protein